MWSYRYRINHHTHPPRPNPETLPRPSGRTYCPTCQSLLVWPDHTLPHGVSGNRASRATDWASQSNIHRVCLIWSIFVWVPLFSLGSCVASLCLRVAAICLEAAEPHWGLGGEGLTALIRQQEKTKPPLRPNLHTNNYTKKEGEKNPHANSTS